MSLRELTKEQAKALAESKFWEGMIDREIALFQLSNQRLCMPWNIFQSAVEKALDREVYSHEFQNLKSLREELLGNQSPPTQQEILDLIPPSKLIKANIKEL
ncbi:MAG: hypothetical protein QNJ64_06855 [Crocosphaera sp.]|nr:hypothetical protein [Crocosphaera sp.]